MPSSAPPSPPPARAAYQPLQPKYAKLTWGADGVLVFALDRAPVNSIVEGMWREWLAIWRQIKYDADVAAVVLCGEGKCFTAGLDLMENPLLNVLGSESDPARKAYVTRRWLLEFQQSVTAMEECDKPVIAAAHGVSYGGGIDIMCAADVRYCEEATRFCIKEVDVGLAADLGTLQRFPRVVGNDSAARELCLTAREFGAAEAERIGFVSKVVPGGREGVLAAAIATASSLARKPPIALRSTKSVLLHTRDHASVREGLEFVAAWNMAMLQSDDIPEAMRAALQRKVPAYPKL